MSPSVPRPEDGTLPEASLIGPLIVATPSLDSLARSVKTQDIETLNGPQFSEGSLD